LLNISSKELPLLAFNHQTCAYPHKLQHIMFDDPPFSLLNSLQVRPHTFMFVWIEIKTYSPTKILWFVIVSYEVKKLWQSCHSFYWLKKFPFLVLQVTTLWVRFRATIIIIDKGALSKAHIICINVRDLEAFIKWIQCFMLSWANCWACNVTFYNHYI